HLRKAIAMADKTGIGRRVTGDNVILSRIMKLHTDYGHALMWSQGFAADETGAAYARVGELASQTGPERNVVLQAQWIASFIRGELKVAGEQVEIFLREAETSGRAMDTAAAHRSVGLTCLFLGEFALARLHLERALADHVPERAIDARRLFGTDTSVTAKAF